MQNITNISFFKRNGRLYVQFSLNGKTKQRSLKMDYTKNNLKLMQENKHVIKQRLEESYLKRDEKNIKTFRDFAKLYLKSKEHLKTYNETQNIVNHQLLPIFGDMLVVDIKRSDVKKWVDMRLNEISPNRMKNLMGIVKNILQIAIEYEEITSNPVDNISLPKHQKSREMLPFKPEEIELLLDNCDIQWFKNYLAVAVYTGMRPGEIIALRVDDVNLKEMYINVDKRIKKGVEDTPKTKSGIRKIPIFKVLVPYLQNQIELAKKINSQYLFFTKRGTAFYSADKLHSYWYNLLEKVNIKKRVMYNTRHTFATMMIKKGVDMFTVSQTLGHKNIHETLTNYAKYLPEENLKIDRNINFFTDKLADS